MTWLWQRVDIFGLCYCVRREAKDIFAPEVNPLDYYAREDGIRELAEELYRALLSKKLNYALEPDESTILVQEIRTPSEIKLEVKGTCLDLALLFCGMCLGCELLPVLILLEGHALVAVSLNYTLRDLQRRREKKLFENVMVADAAKLQELVRLVGEGAYLAVECTGFVDGQSLSESGQTTPECVGRKADGTMSFARAVDAGAQQLAPGSGREFRYALDIATGQRNLKRFASLAESDRWGRPFDLDGAREGADQPDPDPLPYLLDRSEQEEALIKAVHRHRELKPQRPLVCFVHGDEFEYHAAFVDRLEIISLPRILELWHSEEVAQLPVVRHRMKLSLAEVTAQNSEELFWSAITRAVFGSRPATRDDVINLISRQTLAVMFDASLLSGQMTGGAIEGLSRFLDFWNGWEKLPERLLLMVCVSFRYQRQLEARRRLLRFWKSPSVNDELRRYVEAQDFSSYRNLGGVLLPELRAVSQEDAEEVVKFAQVRRLYDLTEGDVIMLYNSELCTPDGCIPMLTLLDHFSEKRRKKR
jgi:inactive STAND